MAKKKFSTPDDLVNSLDDRTVAEPKREQMPAAQRRKSFTPGPKLNARDIALATDDKSMAGQYKRKQILIPPAQLDYIRKKAKELRLSQAALFRWLIDYGLTALDSGVKPDVDVVEVRGEARKTHWSSQ